MLFTEPILSQPKGKVNRKGRGYVKKGQSSRNSNSIALALDFRQREEYTGRVRGEHVKSAGAAVTLYIRGRTKDLTKSDRDDVANRSLRRSVPARRPGRFFAFAPGKRLPIGADPGGFGRIGSGREKWDGQPRVRAHVVRTANRIVKKCEVAHSRVPENWHSARILAQ